MRAYHFLRADMTAGSGREPAWRVGEERTWARAVVLCQSGYHSSPSWYDALEFAPGPVACLVDVSEPVASDPSKQVSATRRLLAAAHASRALRLFACDCAERALEAERAMGQEPDQRSLHAIEVARRYADGQATDHELGAVLGGARAASGGAAGWSAWAAARAAAWSAAWAAAWAAARATSTVAAWAATRATRPGEIDWQRAALEARLDGLFDSAAPSPEGQP